MVCRKEERTRTGIGENKKDNKQNAAKHAERELNKFGKWHYVLENPSEDNRKGEEVETCKIFDATPKHSKVRGTCAPPLCSLTLRFSATQGCSSFLSGVNKEALTMLASDDPARAVAAANLNLVMGQTFRFKTVID